MRRKRERSPRSRAPAAARTTPGRHEGPRPPGGVAEWRRQRLLRAGFGAGLATGVAADPAYDLHSLIELVERGCPPPLAIRILAPLESEGRRC